MDAVIPAAWRELSNVQRDILAVLAATGGGTVSDIADAVGHGPAFSTISRNLSALRDQGYVAAEYQTNADGRYRQTWLTPAGRDVVRAGVVDVAAAVEGVEA